MRKTIFRLALITIAVLLAAALPLQVKAQTGGNTLNVADWSDQVTLTNVSGRETVLKDGDTYHMWYSSSDETKLYHTSSADPDSFTAGTQVTFTGEVTPVEVGSVSVVEEGGIFYMVAYGPSNKTSFAIYSSNDGTAWTYGNEIFNGADKFTDFVKIDGPFLFKTESGFRLYFQVGTGNPYTYDIYVAESTSITGTYTLRAGPVLTNGEAGTWDANDVMHPWVVEDNGTYYMWYSGFGGSGNPQKVGMAKSTDGYTWVKSPANPIFAPETGYAEPSVIKVGDTWQMWTMGTGLVINYLTATGPFEFQSIQAAVNAASAGDTVNVAAGEYVEDITIPAGKQLNFIGEVDAEGMPLPVIKGTLSASGLSGKTWRIENLKFIANLGLIVDNSGDAISLKNSGGNLTVENCIFDGNNLFIVANPPTREYGRAIQASGSGNNLTVNDSIFQNGWYVSLQGLFVQLNVNDSTFTNVKSGINVQGPAGNTVTIDNTNFSVIAQGATNDTYGVRFASEGANTGGTLTITDSSFVVDKKGFVADPETYHSAIIIRSGATGALKVENSSILGEVVNQATPELDASPNWWGSVAGPGASQISGPVDFTPWCTNEGCTTFAPVSGVVELSGTVSVPGGILINEPGITYHLAANTVIQNNSPCFVVNASYTKIYAEPGAKCIPTDSSNGIDVAAGLTDIRVARLEIDGTGQTTGDGIHFVGAVTDVLLADNYIHDLDGNGVYFGGQPTGEQDIHGNLFQNNTLKGIEAGSFTVSAEYNSWGSYDGPAAGDGISTGVDADPYTYGDFWMSSSGSPWVDQVVKGQTITYTIKALVKQVIAADVTFTYPEGLTVTASQAITTQFESGTLTHNAGTRTFTYLGNSTNGNENGTVDLFSVTFTANTTMRDVVMNIVDGNFGMAGVESSSNVYVQGINDGKITVIDRPIISSTDIQGYYLVGEERQFSVVITNPSTGGDFAHVYVDFRIANANTSQITSIEYSVDDGANWVALGVGPGTSYAEDGEGNIVGYFGKITGGGFPIGPGGSLTTLFRVTFAQREQGGTDYPTSYSISMSLKDADTDPDTELATFTKTVNVFDKPSLTSTDIQGYYLSGEQREFSVLLTNPTTGGNFAHVYVNYTIADADMDEIESIEYSVDHTNWVTLGAAGSGTSYGEDSSGNIVGFFGQIAGGGFPMAPDSTQTTWFRVTFKTREQGATDYPTSYAISMQLMDADFTPEDRQLTDFSAEANVYDPPTISSTDITGPYTAGLSKEFQVTTTNPATGGSYTNVLFNYRITGAELADIAQFQYLVAPDTWLDMPLNVNGSDLVGHFGPLTGFPMVPEYSATTTFRITFRTIKNYPFKLTLNDLNMANRELEKFEATAVVNAGDFAITGTFTMQGRVPRGGIPVTLTWTDGVYSASDTTEDLLVNNFQVTVTYGGGYLITTNQDRYLNLTTASAKSITVDGAKTLNALMLRGGNVDNNDNVGLSDASVIGGAYGSAGDPSTLLADANFDGRVNILDLALVGGNYLLTTASAYTSWAPLP